MPITNNGTIEYQMPEEIKKRIPDYFFRAFFGELISVFGPQLIVPDCDMYKELTDNEEYSYVGQLNVSLCMNGGTSGWAEALKQTCKKLSMMWLWEYYCGLEWFDSDLFDGEISDYVIEAFFNDKNEHCNSYYKYLRHENRPASPSCSCDN